MSEAPNLHDTTDASVWAHEFCKRFTSAFCEIEGKEGVMIGDDYEATMLGWFANAIMAGVDSKARLSVARIEELEAENKRLNEQMDAIEEMGTESLNALPDCLMRLAPALVENDELKAKLAKAMQVVEMIASADVDAVLGEAVDLSCEIIGELMEDEGDE